MAVTVDDATSYKTWHMRKDYSLPSEPVLNHLSSSTSYGDYGRTSHTQSDRIIYCDRHERDNTLTILPNVNLLGPVDSHEERGVSKPSSSHHKTDSIRFEEQLHNNWHMNGRPSHNKTLSTTSEIESNVFTPEFPETFLAELDEQSQGSFDDTALIMCGGGDLSEIDAEMEPDSMVPIHSDVSFYARGRGISAHNSLSDVYPHAAPLPRGLVEGSEVAPCQCVIS